MTKPVDASQKSKRLRVLHIRSTGDFLGAENVIVELCKPCNNQSIEHVALILHDSADDLPVLHHRLANNDVSTFCKSLGSRLDFSAVVFIRRILKEQQIDLIHTHGYREDLLAILASPLTPKIATNHLWKRTNVALKAYAVLDSIVMVFFSRLIAVSKPILEDMRAFPWLRHKHIRLISNGVDFSRFSSGPAAEEGGVASTGVVLIVVASLTVEKGHRYLLEALAKLQVEVSTLIVGDGDCAEELKGRVSDLGLSQVVQFLGRQDDIPGLLAKSNVFVLPSLTEGLPMALLEAMAAGCAPIATAVGDIPSVIVNGENGLLVPPGDSDALAQAIDSLIKDHALLEKLSQNALKTIQTSYSSKRMCEEYGDVYHEVIP